MVVPADRLTEEPATRFVQSRGAGMEAMWVVVPRTVTFFGNVLTTAALPSIVSAALALAVPPRNRFPRTTLGAGSVRRPGVIRSPPIETFADQVSPRFEATFP